MSTVYDEKLLDKVGMAMVPSGYTNNVADEGNTSGALGKVYSVLPIQTTSDNLVTNGDFSDGTTDWVPHGDAATQISVVNGRLYVEAATTFDGAKQSVVLDNGSFYKLKADIELDTATRVRVYASSGNLGLQEFTQDGSIEITFDGTSTSNTIVFDCGGAIGNFYIDNVSVVRITDGDFDFSRGSDATRVNSQGYIESVQVLSDELVQNGDFEEIGSELITYSDFNYGSGGWSLVNGKWVFDDVTAGYLNYTSTSVTVGQIYKVVVDVSVLSGVANFRFTSGNAQTVLFNYTDFSDGVTTFYTTVTGVNGNLQRLYAATTLSDAFTLNSISVKEVGQNWNFTSGSSFTENGIRIQADGTYENFSQDNVMTVGKTYKVTYEVTEVNSGGIKFNTSFGLNSGVPSTLGIHSIYATANISNLFFERNGVTDITIDNISVKEITDDTDIPRLDYTNAACPSLLLEPTRENLFLISEPTSADGVSASSPESYLNEDFGAGLKNGVRLGGGASGNFHYGATCLSLTEYSMSFYIKREDGEEPVYAQSPSDTNGDFLIVGNGGLVNTFSKFSIKKFKDDIYKVEATYTTGSQAGSGSNGVIQYSGNSGNFIRITGFQVEQASYPTSYIPTNGTKVTRNRDVCDNAGDSTIFNDSEGVLFLETYALNDSNDSGTISIRGNQTPSVNLVTVKLNYSSNSIQFFIYNNGNLDVNRTINYDLSKPIKLAIKYSVEESSIWINGNQEFGGIIGFTGFSANNLKDISFDTFSGEYLEANVRSVLYFNEALSDAELEYITSADIDLTIHNYKGSLSKISATYEDVGVKDRLTKLF